ncbi:MAG: RyR domain-containing protein [Smithella sp.]
MKKIIAVTGDVIVDHHIYKGRRDAPSVKEVPGTMVIKSNGGAMLLHKILAICADRAKTENKAEYSVHLGLDTDKISQLSADHHSYAVWNPCLKDDKSTNYVWRMTEPMGYGGITAGNKTCQALPPASSYLTPDVLIIDDGAIGFRHCAKDTPWSELLCKKKGNKPAWVVLKMSSPVAQGDLWRKVSARYGRKLVVIALIDDLRQEEVGITRRLSWERTVYELLSELQFNASIRELTKCGHLIISFGSEGALWVNNTGSGTDYRLIYDPACLEGEWGEKYDGRAFGYLSCLTAGIVNQLAKPKSATDIAAGIINGLSAMRRLHIEGHGMVNGGQPGFPFEQVAAAITGAPGGYSIVKVPPLLKKTAVANSRWTIMEGNHGKDSRTKTPLYELARRVALFGLKALDNAPYARFNKLFTTDRSEIESLRGIQNLIKDYERQKKPARPLSIAVFGPPGAGKSFGIKQIAKSVLGNDVGILEFNLSQFSKPEDLIGAFHQVRDEALKGKIPFVFWDEFDSNEYKWLQYLLAPMQDGEFREGQISHPIGKCVFVFAGGTSYTLENFGPQDKESEEYKKFKLVKGPDFVSRLSGYLNVLGPNRRQKFDKDNKKWMNDDNPQDICFSVRRALLLRVAMGCGDNDELDIDKGLLNAFLEIDQYNHGARSLETIALLTKSVKKSGLRRSDLPPAEQMSIHVDYDEFMKLVKRDLPFKLNAESLAPFIHEFYRKLCKRNKWPFTYNMEYDKLPDNIKADNVAAATRLPEIIYLAGLLVVPKKHSATLSDGEIKKAIENGIEILAEAEHDGWMNRKKMDGWVFGKERNEKKKVLNTLISYKDLTDENKEKDRNSVRHYPDIVKMAGFKICMIK